MNKTLEEEIKTSKFRNSLHKASVNLIFTANRLKERMHDYLKQYGITQEQFNVMRILRGSLPTPLCVKDIASRMIFRNSNVPRIIDRLVSKDYVKRIQSDEDKRETLIHLNENGKELLALIDNDFHYKETAMLGLTELEAEILNSLLDKVRNI